MKISILVIKRLIGHFNENKFISIAYLISYVLCIFTFIYVYNNYMPNVIREAANKSNDRYYNITFSKPIIIDSLNDLLVNYSTDYVTYTHFSEEESDTYKIMAYNKDLIETECVNGRVSFTNEEKTSLSNVAILPANDNSLGIEAKRITVDGIKFNAIGWHSGGEIIVPEIYFKNGILGCDRVEIYLNNTLTLSENERFIDQINKISEIDSMVTPSDMYSIEKTESQNAMFSIAAGFFAMMLVFSYLIKYILDENISENTIYRIVGADSYTIILILIIDILLINFVLSISTCIIHYCLFELLFNTINYYKNVRLCINDYLLIIGITSLFSFITILPKIIKSTKRTVIQSRQDV